jgi:predicted 2-oxoglutarate/Fe(II)-dependent dioxygenase YbiX
MQNIQWFDLPRLEKTNQRLPIANLENGIEAINLDYGIHLYRNAISKEDCLTIIDNVENATTSGASDLNWSGARVNDMENVNDARNCLDLKVKREFLGHGMTFNQGLFDAHKMVEDSLDNCLRHYESLWHLKMHYKEAFNFVKYLPGEYFKIHGDHGPYYSCTISAVVYLNDDYEGGEIEFIRQGLKVKPQAGDIILFPSNFVYEHASCEVFSGIKYSVVIMTDYNDLHHRNIHS